MSTNTVISSFRIADPPARMRLICLPFAGGSASVYRTWGAHLPLGVEVLAVQLPGRETRLRDPLLDSMEAVLEDLLPTLTEYLDKPYALFGHSLGSAIAFELASCFRNEGFPRPHCLFASGRRAPHQSRSPDDEPIHSLPKEEFLERVRQLNGTPASIFEHTELLDFVEPILRADFKISETYQYGPREPLDCPICVFGGKQDDTVDGIGLEAWREHTTNQFDVRMFPGDHFFLVSQASQVLAEIAARISFRDAAPHRMPRIR